MQYPLIGKKELIIGSELIPSAMIADEIGSITLTPSQTEVATQDGTFNIPNGAYDEMSATITLIVPSVRQLGKIFPNNFTKASFDYGDGEEGETGRVTFGSGECKSVLPQQIIIRNACDSNSAQDIRFPQAMIANGGEFSISLGDPISVELQVTLLPNEDGAVVWGEGSLTEATKYDVESGEYKPVSES